MTNPDQAIDGLQFRQVLGHYPTGVVGVTAVTDKGVPTGMTVGTFTSVSLDPPLVAFLPDAKSTTFPRIRDAGQFCVNFLTADQEGVCRALASKSSDKFASISWSPSPSTGSPVIEGALGWIDCEIESVIEAGDHFIVIGRVKDLQVSNPKPPLVFFQGGFGRFASLRLSSAVDGDMLRRLQYVEAASVSVQELVAEVNVECLALVRQGSELVTLASWGEPIPRTAPRRLGQRQPLIPPMGALFAAWEDQQQQEEWIEAAQPNAEQREELRDTLSRVRERGWSLGLESEGHRRFNDAVKRIAPEGATPEQLREMADIASAINIQDSEPTNLISGQTYKVRSISAPVFDPAGHVTMMLTLFGFRDMTKEEILEQKERLVRVADTVTL